jgi:antitoxin HicB
MNQFLYPATFRTDPEGRIVVRFHDLGVSTDGATRQEAMEEAIDCLGSFLGHLLSRREPIPAPSPLKRGARPVPVPLWLAPKLALYLAMRQQGLSNSELARRLGLRETVVRRMLDPDHETKAEKIAAALAALGKHLVIDVQDAA